MKKLILLFTGLILTSASVFATETHIENYNKKDRYRYAQPIMFVERGIEFLIFPDGSFDFNTNIDNRHDDVYYKSNSKRSSVNVTYGTPNAKIQYSSNDYVNRGISISHDRDGKVRRIGNVYLNYDRSGKIKRAGSVYMNYGRGHNATLTQVGGLRVNFNHWGEIVNTRGQVNRYSDYCNYCGVVSCSMDHLHNDGHHNERDNDRYYNDDDHFYYYNQNGNVKRHKKSNK